MFDINKINYMMLEFTSACNARCPACARTKNFVNKNITPKGSLHLTKQHINNLFGVKWNNLNKINIDGNYGDSMYHPHALEHLETIVRTQDTSKIKLYIDTNGGYKAPEFWQTLAKLMQKFHPTSCITFGIDGIDNETHQRYRVRVNLNKVFENAQAFMSAGGIFHILTKNYGEYNSFKGADILSAEFVLSTSLAGAAYTAFVAALWCASNTTIYPVDLYGDVLQFKFSHYPNLATSFVTPNSISICSLKGVSPNAD